MVDWFWEVLKEMRRRAWSTCARIGVGGAVSRGWVAGVIN